MRRRAEEAGAEQRLPLRTVGGSDRRATIGSVHNDTSALHASLHGAVRGDPPEGETAHETEATVAC